MVTSWERRFCSSSRQSPNRLRSAESTTCTAAAQIHISIYVQGPEGAVRILFAMDETSFLISLCSTSSPFLARPSVPDLCIVGGAFLMALPGWLAAKPNLSHPYQAVGRLKVIPPVAAKSLLPAHIPHIQLVSPVVHGLDVESESRADLLNVLAVELFHNRRLPRIVQPSVVHECRQAGMGQNPSHAHCIDYPPIIVPASLLANFGCRRKASWPREKGQAKPTP